MLIWVNSHGAFAFGALFLLLIGLGEVLNGWLCPWTKLPSQVRKLGAQMTYLAPRRAIKTNALDCEIRGGEYVAYDRANFATSLKIWLPKAESGDPEAQTYVGEIFEKGLGQTADAEVAAAWYAKAAEQGYSRALINLGYLYESGLGVEMDLTKAMNL